MCHFCVTMAKFSIDEDFNIEEFKNNIIIIIIHNNNSPTK